VVILNTFETRERSSFAPQKPQGTPWLVICCLVATVAFLSGEILSNLSPTHEIVVSPTGRPLVLFPHASTSPIADVVAHVEPAVVSIDTTIKPKDINDLGLLDLFKSRSGAGIATEPEHLEAHGSGSGVIIRSDGCILTNNHVVKDAENIKVTLNDNRVYTGHVIGHDAYSDVAIVKIDAGGLPTAHLGDSKTVRPGDFAIAIGTPLGLSHTVTMGIVSAIGRSLADLNNNVDLIQTDAAINPGNSGGPLLNVNGDVIGINMAIRTDAQNIGFSIPIDAARDAIDAILNNRPILHPYLGLSMMDYDPELATVAGLTQRQQGVVVAKILTDGPAVGTGISVGDLIETVNNEPVRTASEVQKIVRSHKVGNRLTLHLVHSGKRENVEIILRAFPQSAGADAS
jgi:S1-C subfamily serine protease